MEMKAKKVIFSFFWIFVFCFPVIGAENDDSEKVMLNVDFSIFPLEPADWKGILLAPNGDPEDGVQELRFNPHERTLGYEYRGPSPVQFFRRSVTPEGETVFRVVGEIDLLPTRENLIFFFGLVDSQAAAGPYEVKYMVDSNYTFPGESLVFFNSTGATFYGILGEERVVIEPGASKPVDVSNFFESPAPIALVIRDGDNIRKVLVNKIRFSPERRTLLILRPPKSASSLRIRTQRLTEFLGERPGIDDPGA